MLEHVLSFILLRKSSNMKHVKVLVITTIILMLLVSLLSVKIVSQLNKYKANKEEIAEILNFEARLMKVSEYVPSSITDFIPFFESEEDQKKEEWNVLRKKADVQYNLALTLGFLLVVVVLVYMLINYFTYQSTGNKWRVLGIVFVFSSLSFLFLGLQTPFIEVEAFNTDLEIQLGMLDINKTFEGRTYYLYQNKSVFQLIELLFRGGNILVGMCLVLFSICFPLVKLLASLVVFIKPSTNFATKSVKIIASLGKWSMADVFISAVFLAVFSFSNMNSGVDTTSKTLIGLYFFLAFVVLSIISSGFLKLIERSRVLENNNKLP